MSPTLAELPDDQEPVRDELQRIATHVLARVRHQSTGRFGLVAGPSGIATPAFGPDATVLRLTADALVVETGGGETDHLLAGATLRSLADAVGADLAADFSVGHDTPPVGDPDAPIDLAADTVSIFLTWFGVGWQALDHAIAHLGDEADPARVQLWPEHFDAGTSVAVGPGPDDRVNLGASAGDRFHHEPYLYVGPWSAERPGDPAYWNAPFGALLGYDELVTATDPVALGMRFLEAGVHKFR